VDTGFTTPAIELTVTSSDGKQVERVEISRNGASYVAKREGEATLYEVSAAAVTDLQKAADEMKVAAPLAGK
jgi:hypothetical protein